MLKCLMTGMFINRFNRVSEMHTGSDLVVQRRRQAVRLFSHVLKFTEEKKITEERWRDGSVVESTDCSSEGPEFKS